MTPYLTDSCKYNVNTDVLWIPISGLSGDNIMYPVSPEKAP